MTQKNLISLPARIPVAIDTIGCTTKNNIIVTSIPASALTVFTVISGMINIAIKMIAIIIIALAFFIDRRNLEKNSVKTAFLSVTALTSFIIGGCSVLENFSNGEELQIAISLLSLALSIILIINGIKNTKMLTTNLGLIMICYIIYVTLIMGNWDLVYSGIACVIMGIALLLINRGLSKSFKAREAENNA